MNRLALLMLLTAATRADTLDIASIGQGTYHAYSCPSFDGCQALFPLPDPPLPPLRYHPDYPLGTLAGQYYAPLAESPDAHWAAYLLAGDGDAWIVRWHEDEWSRGFGFPSDSQVLLYEINDLGMYYGTLQTVAYPVFTSEIDEGWLWSVATDDDVTGRFLINVNSSGNLLSWREDEQGERVWELLSNGGDPFAPSRTQHIPEPAEWVLVLTTVGLLVVGVVKARTDKAKGDRGQ